MKTYIGGMIKNNGVFIELYSEKIVDKSTFYKILEMIEDTPSNTKTIGKIKSDRGEEFLFICTNEK